MLWPSAGVLIRLDMVCSGDIFRESKNQFDRIQTYGVQIFTYHVIRKVVDAVSVTSLGLDIGLHDSYLKQLFRSNISPFLGINYINYSVDLPSDGTITVTVA